MFLASGATDSIIIVAKASIFKSHMGSHFSLGRFFEDTLVDKS